MFICLGSESTAIIIITFILWIFIKEYLIQKKQTGSE